MNKLSNETVGPKTLSDIKALTERLKNNIEDFEGLSNAAIEFFNNIYNSSYKPFNDNNFPDSQNQSENNNEEKELQESIKKLYKTIIEFLIDGLKKYDENYFKNGRKIDLGDTKINSLKGLNNVITYLNEMKDKSPQQIKFPSQIDTSTEQIKGCLVAIFTLGHRVIKNINEILKSFEESGEKNNGAANINNDFLIQFNKNFCEFQWDLKNKIEMIHGITRQPLEEITSHKLESPDNIKDCIEFILNHFKKTVNNGNGDFNIKDFLDILTKFYSNIVNSRNNIKKNLNDDRANPESRGINQHALDESIISDKNFSTMMLDFSIFLLNKEKECGSNSKNLDENLTYFESAKKTVELYLPIIKKEIRELNKGSLILSEIVGKLKDAVNGYKDEVNSANEFLNEQGEKDSLDGKKDSLDGKKDSPDGENVSPNGKKDSPDGENVSPNGKNDSQNGKIDIETLYREIKDRVKQIDNSIQPNGQQENQKELKDKYSELLNKIETLTHYFKTIKDIDDEIDRLNSISISKDSKDGNNKGIVSLLGKQSNNKTKNYNISAKNINDIYRNIVEKIDSLYSFQNNVPIKE